MALCLLSCHVQVWAEQEWENEDTSKCRIWPGIGFHHEAWNDLPPEAVFALDQARLRPCSWLGDFSL